MAGAGAPRGLPGERPPSGGGWRTGTASTGTGSTSGPGDVVHHRRRPRTAGPRPGPERRRRGAIVGAAGQVRTGQRPGEAGPAAPHTSAPPWRVRALHKGESAVVEARTVVRRSRSAAGSAPSERARWRPGIGLRPANCSGTESSVTVTRGRGRPVSACSGWSGGRRPAAGCRGHAMGTVGRARRPSRSRRADPARGTNSRESSGIWLGAAPGATPGSVRPDHRGP